jgi:transcription-repair coupling factor (superfamily II helicase)
VTIEELKSFYDRDPKTLEISDSLRPAQSKLSLRGMVGSGASLVASSLISNHVGAYLFVLNDKEEAAYFYNDLENILGSSFKVLFFPRSARVPYQIEQTENANIAMRAEVLNEINKNRNQVVVVSFPEAIAEQVVTKKNLTKNTFDISLGESYALDFVDEALIEYGFDKVDYVYEPGQYSIRGGIVDIFSYSFDHPYRIEFFGDEVESIRKFDPVSQLSINKMTRATVVPNVGEKMLHESHESFLEFMPDDALIWLKDAEFCREHVRMIQEKAETQYEELSGEMNHLKPHELYIDPSAFQTQLSGFRVVEFGGRSLFPESKVIQYDMVPQPSFNKNFELLGNNLHNNHKQGYKNVIVSGQPKQLERLHNIFEDREEVVPYNPLLIEINEGFIDKELKLLCYSDHQIFERYHRFRLKEGFKKNKEALTIKELSNLEPGDFVVHIDHGIGQFSGLQKLEVNGKEQEAIRLTYQGGDILYVSIHSLHRISKYSGKEGTAPKIHRLGTNAWQNTKNKTKTRVKEIAFDLLQLYAKRKNSKGFQYSPDTYLQTELEASFMYEDTPDQLTSTQAIKEDMEGEAPMDRLVCGDVGFGKTEIAIRAAFKAVTDSKQVAVLVPTTILSLQHFKTFKERLKEFPCKVSYINRFKTGKSLTQTLKELEDGDIDIIIGTHALVGKRIKFKNLGLMIIDEEQKFGVAVKDKLKTLKANVDTLTLTATPIPRTLQFSLMGARDLSIINTPPPNRYPVETELRPFNEEVIRDAVSYEISRGGQVYFVHNRIGNIKEVAGMIQRLVPDARVGIGHGQLNGEQLEQVMSDFIEGIYDVLVATTIIESGIDISNANTMIINDAHNFGLSDLHQLRGRVGRSNKRAFCYLLAPPMHALSSEARKRLQAIEQFSDLGSGINIAMRDLDIRGAGNMLGGEQSGFISDIGFDMYQKILNEAIQELKEEEFKDMLDEEEMKSQDFVSETVLETDFEILIPDDYVQGISERIQLYRELDDISSDEQLDHFKQHLLDRFGPLPQQAEDLLRTIHLRELAKQIGFEKVILKTGKMIGYFVSRQDSPYYQSHKFSGVLDFMKAHPKKGKMYEKNGGLRMSFMYIDAIEQAIDLLELIQRSVKVPA